MESNWQYDIDKTGLIGQNNMTVDNWGAFIQFAGWSRWRVTGYLHLRCFPRVSQGFLLVLVPKARSPRTFPRHLFPDLLCDLFGLWYRGGGSMEYVLRSNQLLVFFVKPMDLCKCPHHSYHCLVIFTLSSQESKVKGDWIRKLLSHLSNLE